MSSQSHLSEWHDLPLLLTVPEVCALLRIGRSHAYNLIGDRTLQSVRLGRSVRVPRESILNLIPTAGEEVEHE
jgi:excisionase family DNA binding protein